MLPFLFLFLLQMKTKHSHRKNNLFTQVLSVLMVAVLFFALILQAFHYHDSHDLDSGNTASIVKYAPQCPICDVITHQVNTNFMGSDFIFECKPPMISVKQPFDAYQLHFYQPTLQTSKNKGPPATLLVA